MNSSMMTLEGRVAAIMGARRGIGRAIGLAFAEAGADIAVSDIVIENGELETVADAAGKMGRRSLATQVDIRQKKEIETFLGQILEQFGKIDILINTVGIPQGGKTSIELKEEVWDRVIDTNLKGYFLSSQVFGKQMTAQKKGTIINIASSMGIRASPGRVAYAVSKAGIIMLTRCMALELAAFGIRVNAIAPGLVNGEFSEKVFSNPDILKEEIASIPMGVHAEADDIASAAIFLASNMSGHITGQTFPVDGGQSI
jgi:dehydrogenase/reductase SDR family member 4